ncbi:two-component system response regulator CseB [Streptomyces spectabilis]|uniref:DNA-binding response OmpR family regulator n=1 Tax=Streptomyces spectabilis TaxID=68270 RepID=A0A5P2X3C2_STRST|nr:two-component system response regulator CseB [Streptomyces spectabilis]MBB5102920.1 DNA-binding response OmpR family regulator [Streptomyces spectabilis]MCI3902121.1 response regulator transcription factor [Streptomyces spectabilis]QEV59507.1 DNA-binding response regulator [Streptomyces spectabilis]GGV15869.1 transcriptional regulatory protein CseB [Streptomyces spectabilis]
MGQNRGGGSASVRVLLVEDDDAIRRSVGMALERYGYEVSAAPDGLTGLEMFRDGQHDLLLLDIMLPFLDGIGLCRRIRETSQAPILMMSARGDALDVVAGLEAGADDYVIKPVDTTVLVARIRTLLRRATFSATTPGTADDDAVLTFRNLTVDTRGLEVRTDGHPVALTPTELRLLLEFVAAPGIVLERQRLLRTVWDYGWEGDSRVVDLAVQRLRKKIGADHIETARGFGYKFRR